MPTKQRRLNRARLNASVAACLARMLRPRELVILVGSPYEANGIDWNGPDSGLAKELQRVGLLEQHPSENGCYRVTEAGEQVVDVAKAIGLLNRTKRVLTQ